MANAPVNTAPKESVTFPLLSGKFPFTFCMAPLTSAIGIALNDVKAEVPLPLMYPVILVVPVPPLATVMVYPNFTFVILLSAKSIAVIVPLRILVLVTASSASFAAVIEPSATPTAVKVAST